MGRGRKRVRSQVTAIRNAIRDATPGAPANSPDPIYRLSKKPKLFSRTTWLDHVTPRKVNSKNV